MVSAIIAAKTASNPQAIFLLPCPLYMTYGEYGMDDGLAFGVACGVDFPDVIEQLCAPLLALRAGDEVGRQLLPGVLEAFHPLLGIGLHPRLAELVGFGEDDGEGNLALSEPVDELAVNLLRLQADVYQYEEVGHLLPLEDIAAYHLLNLVLHRLGAFGEAIAG